MRLFERLFESVTEYVLRDTSSNPLAFILVLALLSCLVFLLFQVPHDIYMNRKLFLILSLVPSAIAFVFSIYMASYGMNGWKILNPGVYLITLLVFSGFFFIPVLIGYGFDLIIDR